MRGPSKSVESKNEIVAIIEEEISGLGTFAAELASGAVAVGRSPLR